jgi:thiol-disulfide isomerase/thioredoxin
MKLLLSFLLCCFFANSDSKQAQSKSYEITGNVENLPAKSIFIRIMKKNPKNNQAYWPKIDSAKVINGKFILNKDSLLLDPAWASSITYIDTNTRKEVGLKFKNQFRQGLHSNFILENAKISISGDASSKTGLLITGSKETNFNFKYGLIFPTYGFELGPKIDSLKKAGNIVALNEVLNKKRELAAKFKSDFRTIIKDNPSTHQSLLNLYQNSKEFSPTELEELVQLLDPSLLKTDYGTKMLNYIKQSKLILTTLPFPDFSYNTPLQRKVGLTDVKGTKGTVVVFWASWCGPCRAEIPDLKILYAKYHAKGINMVSISVDHNINDWKKALAIEKMPWPNLSNLPGDHNQITAKFNVNSIPSIFLLDKDNKIILADADFANVEDKIKMLAK